MTSIPVSISSVGRWIAPYRLCTGRRVVGSMLDAIGAPWLDAARLSRLDLDGIRLCAEDRETGRGVRIEIADRARLRPVAVGVRLLAAIRDTHRELTIDAERFDHLAGTDALRLALDDGRSADEIVASWRAPLETFADIRRHYLRY